MNVAGEGAPSKAGWNAVRAVRLGYLASIILPPLMAGCASNNDRFNRLWPS